MENDNPSELHVGTDGERSVYGVEMWGVWRGNDLGPVALFATREHADAYAADGVYAQLYGKAHEIRPVRLARIAWSVK